MIESLTLSLTSKSSVLKAGYFPPIELDGEYELGLIELLTFNSIPNIDLGCNKFYTRDARNSLEVTELPTGSYEIEDIERALQEKLKEKKIDSILRPNNNTLKSIVHCSHSIDFRPADSIASLLGFKPQILEAYKYHESDLPVTILKVNTLRVECNITSSAYHNHNRVHTIHEFFPAVPPGYKIIEIPRQIIYLPVNVSSIDQIQLYIVDQDGNLINFRGETISIRLHLRRVG